jgi:O-antigen/teichoic acid export membrane protein
MGAAVMLKGELRTIDNEVPISSWPKRLLTTSLAHLTDAGGQKWLVTLIDQGIVSAAGLFTSVIIGRICAKEQLGFYFLGLSLITFLMEPLNAFVWSPYTVFSPRLKGTDLSRYSGSSLLYQLAISTLGILILMVSGFFFSKTLLGSRGLEPVIWALVVVIFFITLREYIRRIFFVRLRMMNALIFDSLTVMLQISGLVLIVFLGELTADRAFVVLGLACALTTVVWFWGTQQDFIFSIRQAVLTLGQNWSFGKWVLGSSTAIFLGYQIFPWFLASYTGPAAVGMLAACQGVVTLANPFLQGSYIFLESRAASIFAQGGRVRLRQFVGKSTMMMGTVLGLFCVGIYVFGDQVAVLLYGPQYGGNHSVIFLLALTALVSALDSGIYFAIRASGRPDLNFKINLIRLGVTLTLGLWLVHSYGLLGVAWGLLISSFATFAAQMLIYIKLFYCIPSDQIKKI